MALWAVSCGLLAACATTARELPVAPPGSVGLAPEALAEVDAVMGELVADGKIAGAVVVVARRGQVAYQKTFGVRDLESGAPMTEDTIFRIYSMTKPITSAAALMLVENGRLGLDDPVAEHLPELASLRVHASEGTTVPPRQPTVRDLLLHTAGFVYGAERHPVDSLYRERKVWPSKDLNELVQKLGDLPLAFAPGSRWAYSFSTDLVGLIIERVSGRSLDVFLRERIFEPLDMRDTGFHVPADRLARLAAFYKTGGGELTRIDDPSGFANPPTLRSGGGGLVSTARDYLRFLMMIHQGGELNGRRLLEPESVRLMTTDQLPDSIPPMSLLEHVFHGYGFGMGFYVRTANEKEWDPAARLGEYGWGGGASTHFWVSPRDDLIVVTFEQRTPQTYETQRLVKPLVYSAIPTP